MVKFNEQMTWQEFGKNCEDLCRMCLYFISIVMLLVGNTGEKLLGIILFAYLVAC